MVQSQQGATDTALQTYLEARRTIRKRLRFICWQAVSTRANKTGSTRSQMYQKVLAIKPDDAVASNNMAYVMLQQGGNVDVAFAMAQTARRQLPGNASSADTLGWAFFQKHVYTSAIGLFQEAAKKEPDNPLYAYHLGLAYVKTGQASLARQQLERLTKIKPNSTEAEDLRRNIAEASKGQG